MTGTSSGMRPAVLYGEAAPTASLNLNGLAEGAWGNIPGFSFTVPKSAVYRLTADVTGGITASGQPSFNRLIQVRLTRNAAAIAGTLRQLGQVNWSVSAGNLAAGENISGSITKQLALTAGDVIAVQAAYQGAVGTAGTLAAGSVGASALTWTEVLT